MIVVNAGDIFTGNAYVDYAHKRGEPIINIVGYDLNCWVIMNLTMDKRCSRRG